MNKTCSERPLKKYVATLKNQISTGPIKQVEITKGRVNERVFAYRRPKGPKKKGRDGERSR